MEESNRSNFCRKERQEQQIQEMRSDCEEGQRRQGISAYIRDRQQVQEEQEKRICQDNRQGHIGEAEKRPEILHQGKGL